MIHLMLDKRPRNDIGQIMLIIIADEDIIRKK